jgi:uncharacterized protein YecT (DUF1311 family)
MSTFSDYEYGRLLQEHQDARDLIALMREQFAWIAREAGGDCDPDRIIRACNIALEAVEAA